jgi:hypothetical protein
MGHQESAAIGFGLVAAGMVLMAWGYRHRGTWLEGDNPPEEGHYSLHRPPSAPGIKRMAAGVILIIIGMIVFIV